ncbi:MAG: hypothetical protein JXB10_08900 [Pirellulales bacterium]|nr:hypothetical protein [Pirellulales bacterium]
MSAPSRIPRPSPQNAVRALGTVLARQGAIVASWQTYRGRKLGPYYRLAYRAEGRQRSIYLGKSKTVLRQVRRLLKKIQEPIKTRRTLRRAHKAFQAVKKEQHARSRIALREAGLDLRGYDLRGWRRYLALHAHLMPRDRGGLLRKLSVTLNRRFFNFLVPSPHPLE